MSHTRFELGATIASLDDAHVVVTTSVANIGDRDGADVVQVYVRLPQPDAPRRLAGFARAVVAAGASISVEIRVPLDRLATRDPVGHGWTPPSGVYQFTIARHATHPGARHIDVEIGGGAA